MVVPISPACTLTGRHIMKTLRLDLDSLRVESFGTDTVDARVAEVPPTYDRSCILSCPLAC
jgi:hypothetical protein